MGLRGHLPTKCVSLTMFLCEFAGRIVKQRSREGVSGST